MRAKSSVAKAGTVVALLLLSSCATFSSSTDAALQSRVTGQWTEFRKFDACEEHHQRMAIRADGTFEVKGRATVCDKATEFTWGGTWQVKGGKFRYTTAYSEPPDFIPLGKTFEDAIVSVTDDEWVMIEQSTGNNSIARRVK